MSKDINYKNLKQNKLEDYIIELIESKNNKCEEIIDYYVKKIKFKPHKKLNDKINFIECMLKSKQYKLLDKYVSNLLIHSPNYNIINTSVKLNDIEILKKYIKIKGVNKFQFIENYTPMMIAIENKNIECLDILIQNGVSIEYEPELELNITPIEFLFDVINKEKYKLNDKSLQEYLQILDN